MGKILSVVNQKGGVGKTTSCINLIAALGKMGKKCLLVDIDAQGNSTSGLGINKREVEISTYDLLISDVRCRTAIAGTAAGRGCCASGNVSWLRSDVFSIPEY